MAYSLTCADTGADCPGSFTTEGKDELVEHVVLHATHSHPDLAGNPELGSMVQGLIKAI
jgi:predicted small metal-binding protein